jgi:hypothetical protein
MICRGRIATTVIVGGGLQQYGTMIIHLGDSATTLIPQEVGIDIIIIVIIVCVGGKNGNKEADAQ